VIRIDCAVLWYPYPHCRGPLLAPMYLSFNIRFHPPTSPHQYIIVVTGDHSTPVKSGDHSFEPVPVVIAPVSDVGVPEGFCDAVQVYDEIAAAKGLLGRFNGSQLMPLICQCRTALQK